MGQVLSKMGLLVRVIRARVVLGTIDKVVLVPTTGVLLEVVKFWVVAAPTVGVGLEHQQESTFLIPSYFILLHLIPLILGVRRE